MSVSTANVCPAILTSLIAEGVQDESKINAQVGTLGALLSAENRAYAPSIKAAFNDGGHKRTVRIAHKQRTTFADAETEKTCGGGPENPYLEEDFDVTSYAQMSWKVSESLVRSFCREYSTIQPLVGAGISQAAVQNAQNRVGGSFGAIREIAQEFMYQAPGLVSKINKMLLSQFAIAKGKWAGGATSKSYAVQNSDANGGGPLFAGLSKFYQDLNQIGFTGTPHVVSGFGALDRVVSINGANYCCSQIGVNFNELMSNVQFRLFVDRYVATDFDNSQDDAVIFYPGMANLIQYLEYDNGNLGGKIDNIWRMSIPMPGVPGMMADLRIIENGCDEDYDFVMGTYFDLYAAPLDMYKSGDPLYEVNGILQGTFTQA